MQDLPLAGFDKEARQFVLEQYKRAGIHFHGCSSPSKISKGGDGKLTITVEPYKREGDPFEIEGVDEVSSGGYWRVGYPAMLNVQGMLLIAALAGCEPESG